MPTVRRNVLNSIFKLWETSEFMDQTIRWHHCYSQNTTKDIWALYVSVHVQYAYTQRVQSVVILIHPPNHFKPRNSSGVICDVWRRMWTLTNQMEMLLWWDITVGDTHHKWIYEIYVFLLLCLGILIVCLCIFIVPADTLRLPWLRFFRAFPSVVRQMPG